jgi:hypothetical protein
MKRPSPLVLSTAPLSLNFSAAAQSSGWNGYWMCGASPTELRI